MTVLLTGLCPRTGSECLVEAPRVHFLWRSWVGTEAWGIGRTFMIIFLLTRNNFLDKENTLN